jgi:hypothetical protein
MAIKARIFWDVNASAYVVSTAYNEKAVDALKSLIPSGDRSWDSGTKLWYVKEPYGEALRSLFASAFGIHAVSFTSKQVAEQAQTHSQTRTQSSAAGTALNPSVGTTEDAIIAFFGLLSYDAAKQSYRRAATDLHPDKQNGDASRMSRLNDLWARIEKEYFKR